MREILFRGKTNFEGRESQWIYGSLLTESSNTFPIIAQDYDNDEEWIGILEWATVDPYTVGQYTGLTDKNGKRIFEGDIVNVNTKPNLLEHGYRSNHLVVRFDEYHRFVASGRLEYPLCNHYEWEVIGNIHDNPELLKGGE